MKLVCLDLAHQDSIDIETGPRFRESRTAVEDTGAIGGGERMELQTKTQARIFVPVSLRDDPLPHQGAGPTRPVGP